MNTLLLILIDMFMNFAAWDAGQGCCTIPQAVAGHCSEDAIRKYRESMDFNGSFVPCNDGDLLFFFQISGEEYDAKQRKFTAATPGWWKTHSENAGRLLLSDRPRRDHLRLRAEQDEHSGTGPAGVFP